MSETQQRSRILKTAYTTPHGRNHLKRIKSSAFSLIVLLLALGSPCVLATTANDTVFKTPGYSLNGTLNHPNGPTQWPLSNPAAPQGGTLRMAGIGNFDSFNPYSVRGLSPIGTPDFFRVGISEVNETLLVGSSGFHQLPNEAATAYGLIAEWVEYPESVDWVIFHLRPNARFHDQTPITAQDVAFSFETLISDRAHPRYSLMYKDVKNVEVLDDKRVRFTLQGSDRWRLPLSLGALPVLPKHHWQSLDIGQPMAKPALNSGPYRIKRFELGRYVEFEKDTNYWGKDLPIHRGRFNFQTVRVDFFRDHTVRFEAFKSGNLDVFLENMSKNWAQGYSFKAVKDGRVRQFTLPNQLPSMNQAFFLNTQSWQLQDRRVRHAIGLMLDFEWINQTLFFNAYTRNRSAFPNSDFAATNPLTAAELTLLTPHADQLPNNVFDGNNPIPTTAGNGRIRPQIRQAIALLKDAGWQQQGRTMTHTQSGKPLKLELLMSSATMQRVITPFQKNLERIGIELNITMVDKSVYKQRLDQRRYDIMIGVLGNQPMPGDYLREYYSSSSATRPSSNYAGIQNPVVDELIEGALSTRDPAVIATHMRALDRVLINEWYMIPHWHLAHHRVAMWNTIERPAADMPYTLGIETWWATSPEKKNAGKKAKPETHK